MNEIICIDTQILVWGVVKLPPNGNENLVQVASDFMRWIEEQKYRVIIPTIVVSELLIVVPPEKHAEVLQQFQRDWRVVEFDIPAARQFAEMRRDHIIKHRLMELLDPNRPGATKEALKADVMIIATAIAHGAQIIYSHNKDLRTLAEGFIIAKSFEDESFQMSMNLPGGDGDE